MLLAMRDTYASLARRVGHERAPGSI